MLQRLETLPLFVEQDIEIDSVVPKFTEREMERASHICTEEYSITLGAGGRGTRYWVELPNGDKPHVSRVDEGGFYGDAVRLINEYVKNNPSTETAKWIKANARELNIAQHYWAAVKSRKIAELHALKANISLLEARSFAAGRWGLTDDERKGAVISYGFDPERSYGYE